MSGEGKGALSPPSRVKVAVTSAGFVSYTGKDGNTTILELIDISIRWGLKAADGWEGRLVKEPEVIALLDKIKKKGSPHSAKLYASKLPDLLFLDYRYGACEKLIATEDNKRYPCNAAIVIPGLDGYKCSRCGYVFRADFAHLTTTQTGKKQRRKEKKIEQVPLDSLPASQLDLFQVEESKPPESEPVTVWAELTDEDHEAAHRELLESYNDD